MNEEWWEKPTCFFCDYWWVLLLLFVLALAGYFSRGIWMPAVIAPTPTPEPEPTLVLGTGDVQVTLRWAGLNDLDLYVTDPAGEQIFYQHMRSESGGYLDVDSNLGCRSNITHTPVENIFWPAGGAPTGQFKVHIDYYANCGDDALTPFEVRILVDGKVDEFTGQVDRVDDHKLVAEFSR